MEDHIKFSEEQDALILLDQRYLPTREEDFVCSTVKDIIYALQTMVVRGAPAIGVTAAFGAYLATREVEASDPNWRDGITGKLKELVHARPTAVNLAWAIDRMYAAWQDNDALPTPKELGRYWLALAREIQAEDIAMCKAIGRFGGELLEDGDKVMTHCNAGALATAGYGTALGVIRGAVAMGKHIEVIANETRPFLQGARLTAYELHKDGIPVKVACDNACSLLMARHLVDKVVVGADRIAANGDVANKIGTSGVAILANHYGIPFYVAAPSSTFDANTPDGSHIPVEDRPPREVTHVGDVPLTPKGVEVFNLAFDITLNPLITGIITEQGVVYPPYKEHIAAMIAKG